MRAKLVVMTAVAWALAGCAGAASRHAGRASSSTTLTYEQLVATNSETLYDAITKLRPDWLTSRGPKSVTNPQPSVVDIVMNGTTLGNVDYLRQLNVLDVAAVRFWDPGQATARFGNGHPRGVIEITRR